MTTLNIFSFPDLLKAINHATNGDPVTITALLESLTDVSVSSPSNGQALVYNGTEWVNQLVTPAAPVFTLVNTSPGYLNGWIDEGSGFQALRFAKDAMGFVHIEGACNGTSATADTIFTLPAGYRPAANLFPLADNGSSGYRIDILTDGSVKSATHGAADIHMVFYPG